jgi:hypothetical protein
MQPSTPDEKVAQLEVHQEFARKRLDDASPAVRLKAVEMSGVPILNDPDWRVRLASIGILENVEDLVGRLDKESGRLQDECRQSLRKLTGKDFGADAQAWLRWHREEIETPVKMAEPIRFFGHPVVSRRIAFVLDPHRDSIDELRREMARTIERLPPETRFTVVTIGGKAWDPKLVAANEMNKALAIRFLERHEPRKASDFFDALSIVLAADADTVCLYSAGEPTQGVFISDDDIVEHLRPHGLVRFVVEGKPAALLQRLQALVR